MRSNYEVQGFTRLSQMFDNMDKDDVIAVWRLYKEKYGDKLPDDTVDQNNTFEKIVYHSFRVMFEPQHTDREWNEMELNKVHKWFLYQPCGVHELVAGGTTVYLLVEMDYHGLNKNREILKQMVKPGFLKCQRHYLSDHQAYKLTQKYDKILDPSIRKRFHRK